MKGLMIVLSGLTCIACAASREPGWEGGDATPFDTALAACRTEAESGDPVDRDELLEACMERHGWRRPD